MKTTVTILLVLFTATLRAANCDSTHTPSSIRFCFEGFFRANYNKLNLDDLNNVLSANILKYSAPVTPAISLGGGGTILFKRLILGGEGQTLLAHSNQYTVMSSNANYTQTNTYGGGYGVFNVGFAIVANKRLIIYPQIGIGGGHFYALIVSTLPGNNFQYNLSNPNNILYQKMVNKSFILNPKVCADVFFSQSYVIGIDLGYNYMTSSNWTLNDVPVTNGPASTLNGFYAGITIGVGGYNRD